MSIAQRNKLVLFTCLIFIISMLPEVKSLAQIRHRKLEQDDEAADLGNEDAMIYYIDSPQIKRLPKSKILDDMKKWKKAHIVFMGSGECPHCQHFGGKFQKVALKTMKKTKKIEWNFIDCHYDGAPCQKLGVTKWPFVGIFKNGKMVKKYMGKKMAKKLFLSFKLILKKLEHD